MASTYSPKLKFELIGAGEQAGLWGTTTNKNVGELIEQAIAGVTNVDLTAISGDYVLSSLDGTIDQARSAVVSCFGTAAGAVNIVIPTSTKLYVFRNACGFPITIKTAGQVGGVILASGEANSVFCDGAIALAGLVTAGSGTTPVSGGGTGATSFTGGFIVSPSPFGSTALTSISAVNLSTMVSGQLGIANGGTGISTTPSAGSLLIGTSSGGYAVGSLTQGTGITITPSSGGITISTSGTSGVASISGTNIGVSSPVGAVNISLNSSNVINALGYTPANGSLYAALNSSPTFTGSINATAYVATGAGSQGDQKFSVSYGGFSSGLAPASLQLGASGKGLVYDGNYVAMGGISGGAVWSIGASTAVMVSSTDNVQKPSGGPWLATVSDARHKENVVDYPKGLEAITALRPVNYTFKGKYGEQTNYEVCTGLIAQEVLETPLSSMVGTNEDGFHNLNPNEISYALINAVKELSAQVKELQAEVAELKAK